jgi:hypothetical protein
VAWRDESGMTPADLLDPLSNATSGSQAGLLCLLNPRSVVALETNLVTEL